MNALSASGGDLGHSGWRVHLKKDAASGMSSRERPATLKETNEFTKKGVQKVSAALYTCVLSRKIVNGVWPQE